MVSVGSKFSIVFLDVLSCQRRTVARVLDRLEVSRPVCTIPFELDDNEFPPLIEGEDIQPVASILEIRILGGNDE